MNSDPINTLMPPSAELKTLLQQVLKNPIYKGEDEDLAMANALESIWKTHGDAAFDPLNPTDQILRQLAKPETGK